MSFLFQPEQGPEEGDKYQRIIKAAVKVFSQKGFYNSKVSDVAKEANVADGTIYLYFKNKDDLLISIFEHCIDHLLEQAQLATKALECPIEKLKTFVITHLSMVERNQNLSLVMQVELRGSHQFMTEYKAEKFFTYLGLLKGIILEGQQKNVLKNDIDPTIAKRMIFGAIDELALEWVLMKKKRYNLADAAEQLFQMLYQGLKI